MQDKDGDAGQKLLTMEEAIAFVSDVKVKFQDKREKYNEFLKILGDYRAQIIDIEGVTTRIEDLFKGHSDLILKFKYFLPNRSGISDDTEEKEEDSEQNPPDRLGSPTQEVKLLSQKTDTI